MNAPLIQMEPCFDERDVQAVADCVASTWVNEAGRTAAFEGRLADYVGARYAVAVPSCTVALAVSLMGLGIGPGDEVIVPDLTFVATANAVELAGATPVLADVDPETMGLDPAAAAAAVTTRTRALMPVWYNGRAPALAPLLALAESAGLALVEDAACALGSSWQGRHAGTFGQAGCFSFNTTKIITTGTGGLIVTDDPALHERVKRLKNHGRLDRRDFHPLTGFNFGFSDLLAALGLSQLNTLGARVAHRRELHGWYAADLEQAPAITVGPLAAEECLWYPDLLVDDPRGLQTHLAGAGIGTRLFFPPLHTQPAYRRSGCFPGAELLSARGLWLPARVNLTRADARRVTGAVRAWADCRALAASGGADWPA